MSTFNIRQLSHLQSDGSCKQLEHITLTQPVHVLFFKLHVQCLHLFIILY